MEDPAPLLPDDVLVRDPAVDLLEVDGRVVGVGPDGPFTLDDVDVDGLRATLALVDGARPVAAIVAALAARYVADDVLALLDLLVGALLRRVEPVPPAPAGTVVVLGAGRLAQRIEAELSRGGLAVEVVPSSEGARLEAAAIVVCALEAARGRAALDVAGACAAAGRPLLHVGVEAGACVVGPLTLPRRTACWGCSRLSTTLRAEVEGIGPTLLPELRLGSVPDAAPGWWIDRVAFEVRREVEAVLRGTPYPSRLGSLLTLGPDGASRTTSIEAVIACPTCGGHHRARLLGPDAPPPAALARSPAPVRDVTGGARTVAPDEADRRALAAFERLGIRVDHVPLGDEAPEALAAIACPFYVTRSSARLRPDAPLVLDRFVTPAYGKGTTDLQARCSASYEWLERNLAQWRGDRDLVRASWGEVRDRAIDVPFLASGLLPGLTIPEQRPFEPDAPIDWVWGQCLRRGTPILVPASAVFFGRTMFHGSAFALPRSGSSGLSAGCSVAEATLQGLLEIVERDATFTAIRNGIAHPRVEPASVDDEASRALLARASAAGYRVHLRDITSALAVPTVEVYLVRDGVYENHYAVGYGAHLDPAIALRRALTEAVQCLFGVAAITGPGALRSDSSYFEIYPHRRQVLERASESLREVGAVEPVDPTVGARSDIWAQVDEVVNRIGRAIPEADVCVVDLSHHELEGVHVVRTLVTGAFDEAQTVQLHVPLRCRLVPLDAMYLGPLAM